LWNRINDDVIHGRICLNYAKNSVIIPELAKLHELGHFCSDYLKMYVPLYGIDHRRAVEEIKIGKFVSD
jgi:hypothetical protein